MTITVLHLRRLDELAEAALRARIERGERTGPGIDEIRLRDLARRPSLGWSAERIEEIRASGRSGIYLRACEAVRRSAAQALYASGGYRPVARVAGATLDTAYVLTNHVEVAWHQAGDGRVTVIGDEPPASTAPGDLLRDDDTGEIHLCIGDGFSNLGRLADAV